MKIALSLILLAGLAGCANYQWRHADGMANFDQDHYSCLQEAAKALPPQMGERVREPERFIAPQWHCPTGVSDQSKCAYTPARWLRAERETYDVNAEARKDMQNSCLKAKGWAYVRVD